ncbi:MAG: DNA-protecting protein DprA, partial [Holosporales bacterium]|nr:DNA-protecting protein DprA [Holosporales bacterium]
ILSKRIVGIIGARNCSISGSSIAKKLAEKLSDHFALVSGMAKGIDTQVHLGSLVKPNNKSTISILPFGINRIYPKENEALYKRIAREGLLLTEVHQEAFPDQGMFHSRNRIISLLAEKLIVIEAAAKSGTLATAKMALDLGCEVMAVPGSPNDPRSFGSNYLIKNGAALVQDHFDILTTFNPITPIPFSIIDKSEIVVEQEPKNISEKILASLSDKAVSLDEISNYTNISISKLLPIISELELAGKIVKYSTNEISLA